MFFYMSNNSNTTNINIRLDSNLKQNAEHLFKNLGLNMSTAINMFLTQSVREQAIPFKASMNNFNSRLLESLAEANELISNPNSKTYDNINDVFKDLNS